jgi:tetratricopeptide (TPR) repeat protein
MFPLKRGLSQAGPAAALQPRNFAGEIHKRGDHEMFFCRLSFWRRMPGEPVLASGKIAAMTLPLALRRIGILAAAALLVAAVGMRPLHAMGTDTPSNSNDDGSQKKKKDDHSAIEQQQQQAKFLRDYRAARLIILAGNYPGGIAAMHALNRDGNADVANYIGYAYRKMGDYKDSQIWYEKALAADPNHVRTWSYYGMWQMEQGNRLKALDDLQKVKLICGNTSCEAYKELNAVIEGKASY